MGTSGKYSRGRKRLRQRRLENNKPKGPRARDPKNPSRRIKQRQRNQRQLFYLALAGIFLLILVILYNS